MKFKIGDRVCFERRINIQFTIEYIDEHSQWIWSSELEKPYLDNNGSKNLHNTESIKYGKLISISELRDKKLNDLLT